MHTFKGRTTKFYLPAVRYVHGPVRGRYKVAWPEYRAKYLEMMRGNMEAKEKELLTAKVVADLVTEWNLTYSDDDPRDELRGKPLPITPEILMNETYPQSYLRLQNVILGFSESDIDPDDPVDSQLRTADNRKKSADELFAIMVSDDVQKVKN